MKDYVLITGASSSIGRSVAMLLSKRYLLILGGRDEKRLLETKSLCSKSENHLLWRYDLLNILEIGDHLIRFMQEKNISIEGFVHSAGIAPIVPLRLMAWQKMKEVMDINFLSAVAILKILASKKTNGRSLRNVVFISSISSKWGAKGMAMYSASKGALDSFARSMAYELSPHVRINTVLPGGINIHGGGTFFYLEQIPTRDTCWVKDVCKMLHPWLLFFYRMRHDGLLGRILSWTAERCHIANLSICKTQLQRLGSSSDVRRVCYE